MAPSSQLDYVSGPATRKADLGRYGLIMTTPEVPAGFLLTCETAPGDLIEAYAVAPDLRRRRRRASAVAGIWLILFAVIAVISVALAAQGGVRAVGGLAAAAIGAAGFILAGYRRAELSPGALARTVLRRSPRTPGVHTAEIGQAADGSYSPLGRQRHADDGDLREQYLPYAGHGRCAPAPAP